VTRLAMNLPEAMEWLAAHMNLETGIGIPAGTDRRKHSPTLARIQALTDLLGSPQQAFPAVHLTGTNGKTSVTRMAAALLDAMGLSTGSYTSPNLVRVQERMAWRGEPIDDESLAAVLSRVAAVEEFLPERVSYFEILTAAAFDWFAEVAVDVAVVEVGLGGTWDATNIVRSPVAVITNVSVDHVEYLGHTREEIAREKAGIVKQGATLVLGETDPELRECFEARQPSRIILRDRDFSVRSQRLAHGGRVIDLVTPEGTYEDLFLPRPRRPFSARRSPIIWWPKRSPPCVRPAVSKSSGTSRWCCSTARTTWPARTRFFMR
jgi:dihydrofolate synthase/folylpolyglutamate synthase